MKLSVSALRRTLEGTGQGGGHEHRAGGKIADAARGAEPVPSAVHVCLDGGFTADASYYLVHEVQDPIVMGIGLAAVRDAVSFFRYDTSERNPLVARFGGTGGK